MMEIAPQHQQGDRVATLGLACVLGKGLRSFRTSFPPVICSAPPAPLSHRCARARQSAERASQDNRGRHVSTCSATKRAEERDTQDRVITVILQCWGRHTRPGFRIQLRLRGDSHHQTERRPLKCARVFLPALLLELPMPTADLVAKHAIVAVPGSKIHSLNVYARATAHCWRRLKNLLRRCHDRRPLLLGAGPIRLRRFVERHHGVGRDHVAGSRLLFASRCQ